MKKMLILLFLFFACWQKDGLAVSFTLKNNSLRSINLEIPGVMSPNLSPLSHSGVNLEPGQKIYFFHQGERYVLLEVREELQGRKIKVKSLIRKRKKSLGL
jgi:hypothetical protein